MSADEFLAVERAFADARRPRPTHPKGWEPGVDTAARTVTVKAGAEPPADWSAVIAELGLDPKAWTVDETQPVQVRSWDSGDQRMYYYRATVLPAVEAAGGPDVDELLRRVGRARPRPAPTGDGSRALVVALADWQAGKADHGGVDALVDRLASLRTAVPARLRQLKRAGRPVDQLVVAGLGDLVENCDGHYPMQTFAVELDRRSQVRLVRRALFEMVTEWSRHVDRVVVAAVPGNHGENRRGGKAFTTFEDNDDLAVFEQVAEILRANVDAYGHVAFVIPDGDMTVTLDVCGTVVAFAHGHQARRGASPQARVDRWWKDKQAARHPVGDADILVTGHYHHLVVVQDGPRSWFQCPANDGGSRWFEERGGSTTVCGTLSFTVDGDGWADLEVLR